MSCAEAAPPALQAKLSKKAPFSEYSSLPWQVEVVWGNPKDPSTYPQGSFDAVFDNNGKDLATCRPLIDHFQVGHGGVCPALPCMAWQHCSPHNALMASGGARCTLWLLSPAGQGPQLRVCRVGGRVQGRRCGAHAHGEQPLYEMATLQVQHSMATTSHAT